MVNTNKQEEKPCQKVKVHTVRRLGDQERKRKSNNQSPTRLFIESFTNLLVTKGKQDGKRK